VELEFPVPLDPQDQLVHLVHLVLLVSLAFRVPLVEEV